MKEKELRMLVAGSYERFLFGYHASCPSPGSGHLGDGGGEEEGKKAAGEVEGFAHAFTHGAHLGPIKCISSLGNALVTGGTDDMIRIFDVKHQKEMGCLVQHEGSVMSVKLFGVGSHPTHLISGGEDGWVCVWDADNWAHLKTLKGHTKAVNDLTVHPSGRLALSVGRDRHLRMWNLLKGSCTLNMKLRSEAEVISFTPQKGNAYNLVSGNTLTIFNAETGKAISKLDHTSRFTCLAQPQDEILVTGSDDGTLHIWNSAEGSCVATIPKAHSNRIRGVSLLGVAGSLSVADGFSLPFLMGSASSDGFIKLWDMRKLGTGAENAQEPLCEVQTNARLTCLTSAGPRHGAKRVRLAGAKEESHATVGDAKDEQMQATEDGAKLAKSQNEGITQSHRNIPDVDKGNSTGVHMEEGMEEDAGLSAQEGSLKKRDHKSLKAKGGAGVPITKGKIRKASKSSNSPRSFIQQSLQAKGCMMKVKRKK